MRAIVSFSGGKDSQACLIWAVKNYGQKVEAVFCDTGNEHEWTYKHVNEVCEQLGIKLHILKSKYGGFLELAKKKKRFPSTKARFCTEKLKVEPHIDFILSLEEDCIIIQGIRKDESNARSKMLAECHYFKGYFEPVGFDKKTNKPKYHTYRKAEIIRQSKLYAAQIMRPIFDWTAQETINYILENGQKPNPLYYQGFSRVGCFPCIMCKHGEIRNIIDHFPEHIEQLDNWESEVGRTFFPPNYIPTHAQKTKGITTLGDVKKYLKGKNETEDIFEEPSGDDRCMSAYHLCE